MIDDSLAHTANLLYAHKRGVQAAFVDAMLGQTKGKNPPKDAKLTPEELEVYNQAYAEASKKVEEA